MTTVVAATFVLVYLGMILGRWPGLAIDRTGVALLGAIVMIGVGAIDLDRAWQSVDAPTMALLLGLMVLSAQFRLAGAYSGVVRRLAEAHVSPGMLLALLIVTVAMFSAVLANDVVCVAMTPPVVQMCARRRLDPRPFLLALACAANVGSAATLIGNPQNMLVGQTLHLSFGRYLLDAALPAIAGLPVIWFVVRLAYAGRMTVVVAADVVVEERPFNRWQAVKGVVVLCAIILAFVATDWPRDVVALAAAGALLLSRSLRSREMLALVDWQLLVLFVGLFVVNDALAQTGLTARATEGLVGAGVDVAQPAVLFAVTAVLSNLVSNVPAVMLLLPAASHPSAGGVLALSSTLAGNLFVVGSIANIIVLEQAARMGVAISWREHARVGVPVALLTLLIAAAWLLARSP